MKFLLGTKENMTQVFNEDGVCEPVTVLSCGPCRIVQIKTKEKEGYNALQLGFGEKKKLTKPEKGHRKDIGNFRTLKEFRISDEDVQKVNIGDTIDVAVFAPGDAIELSGTSKGKGFQGVVKRWGFKGGPRSHGQKHSEREGGSIGATGPQRVFKGKKMPGRMGGERVTVGGLEVVKVVPEENRLYVRGAVPGRRGSLVLVRGSKK